MDIRNSHGFKFFLASHHDDYCGEQSNDVFLDNPLPFRMFHKHMTRSVVKGILIALVNHKLRGVLLRRTPKSSIANLTCIGHGFVLCFPISVGSTTQ